MSYPCSANRAMRMSEAVSDMGDRMKCVTEYFMMGRDGYNGENGNNGRIE